MPKPKIKKVKRGKHLTLVSPTDSAILQVSDDGHVLCIGFDEDEDTLVNDEPILDESEDNEEDEAAIEENEEEEEEEEEESEEDDGFSLSKFLFG